MIRFGRKGKRRTVIAEDPARLLALQQERLDDLRRVLPQLASRHNTLGGKPRVYSYDGVEGVKRVYEDTLIEQLPIRTFLQVVDIEPAIAHYLLHSYVPRRVRRRIHVKNLVSGTKRESEKILPDRGADRENRFVDRKLFPANIEVLIYGNKAAFISYKAGGPAMGIVIESGEIAETMRSLHALAWGSALPRRGEADH